MKHPFIAVIVAVQGGVCIACAGSVTNAEPSCGKPFGVVVTNLTANAGHQDLQTATNALSRNAGSLRNMEMYEIVPMTAEQRNYLRIQHHNRVGKDLLYDPSLLEQRRPKSEAATNEVEVIIE